MRHKDVYQRNGNEATIAWSHATQMEAELDEVLQAFRHRHVNNGENDVCKQCGLDLRHEIHERVAALPNEKVQR